MELSSVDEDLMEEALLILDSVDIERLGAPAPESAPSETAAEDLLRTAIEAVDAAYPQHGKQANNLKSNELEPQGHGLEEKTPKAGRYANNQHEHFGSGDHPVQNARKKTPPRRRMREQLIQLRSVAQKMENHLETLRSPRSPRFSTRAEYMEERDAVKEFPSDESNIGRDELESSIEATAWRSIAMQQFHARRNAEKQNAELRENLETQIQLSKQVENLLQAHQTDPVRAVNHDL
ncbi:hypothetical protein PR003_g10112 [Phytophthora rubi]|uniref:Uncharacterized protein n=1 Tax=Phytophthora rubi TaxID=129364 RepID=A0A6A4FQA2_9STRA|nr:hypothetical protein PR002_g9874 [Phytophthora rubi]KAE9034932.1 hypothetical protein PR001_g9518 [Phytophthora rubi]KAE9341181.1 hypothetical protein PR003_g10112 [Phytophthora rubi]